MSNEYPSSSCDSSDFCFLQSQINPLLQIQQFNDHFNFSNIHDIHAGSFSAPISETNNFGYQFLSFAGNNNEMNKNSTNFSYNMKYNNTGNIFLQRHNSLNFSRKLFDPLNSNRDYKSFNKNQSDGQHQEFQIQQEDFPALPRPQSVQNKSDSQTNLATNADLKTSSTNLAETNLSSPNCLANSSSGTNVSNKALNVNQNVTNTSQNVQSSQQGGTKKGIIILPDGRIKNVPPNMLLDQFGIVGLLAYLRSADREKDIYTLALGTDLTALGLNLNSNENLYHSFLSPFSDASCRLQDIDFPVPTEYLINFQIKEKLAPIDLSRYHEDTLFYLFYMNGGDLIQLQAAAALFDHDWRYHTEKRLWLTKVPGLEPHQKEATFERGIYTVFDVSQWRKVQMEMSIEYNKLAEKPQLAQFLMPQQQQQQQSQATLSSF